MLKIQNLPITAGISASVQHVPTKIFLHKYKMIAFH